MDPWDTVVEAESHAYNEGFQEGVIAAKESGVYEEGIQSGYLRGFALGLEFGFIQSVTGLLIAQSEESAAKRQTKRRIDLVDKIKLIPNENVASVDFDNELLEARGLYKQCGGNVGTFLKSKGLPTDESSQW